MHARSFCLFLLLFVLSPLGPAGADGAALQRIGQAGEIRIGLTGDYRPFSALDPQTGDFEGLDVDLGRSLAGALGVRPVFVATSWPTLSADLEAGKFDIAMGGISVTEARARIGMFSMPVLSDGKTPITACRNVARFQTLEQIDRKGVRLVVNPGGTNEKFARAHIHSATIIVHSDNVTIFQEIVAGRADLMITDAIETRLQARLHPELCAVHPDKPFDRAEKAYFMPRDAALKTRVDAWLAGLKASGELKRRVDAWVK
jgi:cyclohexadienyl dehydratase